MNTNQHLFGKNLMAYLRQKRGIILTLIFFFLICAIVFYLYHVPLDCLIYTGIICLIIGSIAVITDAGTPCISDPGNELIRAAIDAGIRVVGVPGCCAAVTALSISGFDLSTFFFFGFFPREAADRRRALAMMRRGDTRTYCFYESPKRIMDAVEFFISEHAGVRLCLCNDMTKLHEMTFRGTPAEVRDQLLAKGSYDKGEYVLLCEVEEDYLITEVEHVSSPEALLVDCMVRCDCTAKDAIKLLLKDDNNTYSKNELYAAHLALKERFGA